MSLPSASSHTVGTLQVTVYDFAKRWDALPMHDHAAGGAHICVVARGRLLVRYSDGREPTEHPLGQVIDPYYPHELVALEDSTRVVNVVK